MTPLKGLVGIAQIPEDPRHIGEASHHGILHDSKRTLLGAVEGYPLL
jgi:hypothetical protein